MNPLALPNSTYGIPNKNAGATSLGNVLNLVARQQNADNQVQGASTMATGSPTGTAPAATNSAAKTGTADDIAYLNDQASQLRNLLARTDTGLNQGLTQNEDQYQYGVGSANTARDKQVQNQTQSKLSAYDTINRNAGAGYRSLAQIIGRSAGTGSSAFRDLLPDVIGKDTSSKRMDATNTFGQNLSNIETSHDATLADLNRQKKLNEQNLRSGIENQRQNIQGQLLSNAGQVAQAKGGGYASVKAAQAPFQSAIDNSRNQVESFFNQFRTPYTQTVQDPNLSDYKVDRTTLNAGNGTDPGADPMNPYAALLRKKLQGAS